MDITYATRPTPGHTNEDSVLAGTHFVVVLDGATPEPGTDSGCIHTLQWLVTRLGSHLCSRLTADFDGQISLSHMLRDAIQAVRNEHGTTCDMGNPRSPAAAVAIARQRSRHLDYLVLGDAAVVWQLRDEEVTVVIDDRIAGFPDRTWAQLRHLRNTPGGFWVASTKPAAAMHAYTGTVSTAELRRCAVLTDGGYRLVERYGWTWPDFLTSAETAGPSELIAMTRIVEASTPPGRFAGKQHDDSTIVLWRFDANEADSGC